ncbi:isochorismatase family protein [Peribacillus sp. NPDC096540]|uniref:isochorismatase family protein n=1 Tax=Peribacillus sp. NPDC096540 TaxID=3390612 RepID=UPI003CFC20A0
MNSAFIGIKLEMNLREEACPQVVITGLTTDHCVETTTRMVGNLGFNPILVSDATATFERVGPDGTRSSAELIQQTSLANLHVMNSLKLCRLRIVLIVYDDWK